MIERACKNCRWWVPAPRPASIAESKAPSSADIPTPIKKLIDAVATWCVFGLTEPTINQVGFLAGYTPTAGTFNRCRSEAKSRGLVEYPAPGRIRLTDAGRAAASFPDAPGPIEDFHAAVRDRLDGPLVRLLDPLLEAYPETMAAAELAERAGYTANAGTFNRYRSSLRSLELVDYPSSGLMRAADWLFPGGAL